MLPLGIFATSTLISLSIIVFEPSFTGSPSVEVAPHPAHEPSEVAEVGKPEADCSGARATGYDCYQERYQSLVSGSGVEAAFAELKEDYENEGFVRSICHQLTHVIGRAAADLYGDIPATYSRGDSFCWSGYYHGAMEAVVAKIGADKILEEANAICADLGEHRRYSFYHYNCAHGLGHGFMMIQQNELFGALQMCDTLLDAWERDTCYSGVFMENVVATNNPSHPSKYLKADQPLYPCTDLSFQYQDQCYRLQTSYALETLGNDFTGVFELCATVEDEFRPTCYQSIGRDAFGQSNNDPAKVEATCMLGGDYEARSNCVVGAVETSISYYHSDVQARAFCELFDAALRTSCLQAGQEYYRSI